MKHSTTILLRAAGQGMTSIAILSGTVAAALWILPSYPMTETDSSPAALAFIVGVFAGIWRGHVAIDSLAYWSMLRREERKRGIRYAIREDQRL